MNESDLKPTCPECGLPVPASGGCAGCSLRLALADDASPSGHIPLPPGLKTRFFGDYEILGEIARGGMGVVYRARQLGLNRMVALKMIQSHHLLSDEARLRFRVEIEAVAQLNHPNIVSLYESGEHDGAHYFTMRLVEGGDLASRLKSDPPARANVDLLVKVCRAVHYAHQRGILHRDLKPSNILVDELGAPHVADFGLAKSTDLESGFTFTSSVLGSPNYMAPEQAAGKTGQVTTAVDIYGLGAVLYHLLTGRPPFQCPSPIETLRQVVDRDPTPPRQIRPGVDPDLETIALKCLRKEPGRRYDTAEDLAQDLERWQQGRPILARPIGPLATAWRWSRRHPAAAMLALALTLALAVLAVGTVAAAVRIRRAEQRSAAHLRESLLREASSLRLGSELGHREDGVRLIREAAALGGSEEFQLRARNELLATLARTEPQFIPFVTSNLPPRQELGAIHPHFEVVASVFHETNLIFRGLPTDLPRGVVRSTNAISSVDVFSPDGTYVALWHDDLLSVRDLRNAGRAFTRRGTNFTFTFHPREPAILYQDTANEAVLFDLAAGLERMRWKAAMPRMGGRRSGWHTLAYSPNGRYLVGASENSPITELLDPQTGEQLLVVTNTAHTIALSWSPNSGTFAIATADSRIMLWEATTGRLQWSSPPMIAPAHSIAFHPQREWLAAACNDGKVRFVDTSQQRFIFEFPGETRRFAFSPAGGRLGPVWSEGRIGWLEMRRAEAFAGFTVSQPWVRLTDGTFTPDGRVFAVGHSDMVILCDTERARKVRTRMDWRMAATVFHPSASYLLATDTNGLHRFGYGVTEAGRISLTAPSLLHEGARWRALAFTPDGRRLAGFNGESNAALIFDQTLTNLVAAVGPHTEAESIAISADARWLTTGSRSDRAIRVWDLEKQTLVTNITVGLAPRGAFSNDGRWLAAFGDRFELREAGTWKPAPPLRLAETHPIFGAAAFSPDSRFLAVVVNGFTVHLFDLQRFESVGVLRPPAPVQLRGLAFSPDGGQLAGYGSEARVALWNLRALERRLDEFGLAW